MRATIAHDLHRLTKIANNNKRLLLRGESLFENELGSFRTVSTRRRSVHLFKPLVSSPLLLLSGSKIVRTSEKEFVQKKVIDEQYWVTLLRSTL